MLALLMACSEPEDASPVAVEVRRLGDPAERLSALEALERICESVNQEWAYRFWPPKTHEQFRGSVEAALRPVLTHVGVGSDPVQEQALATLRPMLRVLMNPNPIDLTAEQQAARQERWLVQLELAVRALSTVLAGEGSERARSRAASMLGTVVTREERWLSEGPALAAPLRTAIDAAFATVSGVAKADRSDEVRSCALYALGERRRKQSVPIVVAGLRGPWNRVDHSSSAVAALQKLGELHAEARVALIAEAADPKLSVQRRRDALGCLSALGGEQLLGAQQPGAIAALTGCLGADDAWLRGAAVRYVPSIIGANEAAVSALLPACRDRREGVREAALQALGAVGIGSEAVIDVLVGALQDKERHVRQAAAQSLAKLGPKAERALDAILAMARSPNRVLRKYAITALAAIGRMDAATTATLIRATRDEHWPVRSLAVEALGASGSPGAAIVSTLQKSLKDEHDGVRGQAVAALGNCARESDIALQAVIDVLGSAAVNLRDIAAHALRELGPRGAKGVPQLIAGLASDDEYLTLSCILALDAIGPKAVSAVPALRKLARVDSESARSIGEAIWHIDDDPSLLLAWIRRDMLATSGKTNRLLFHETDSVEKLIGELNKLPDPNPPPDFGYTSPAESAAWELGRRGERAVTAAHALAALIPKATREENVTAAAALARMGKPAVPLLVALLPHERVDIRLLAIVALGELGTDAKAALKPLRTIVNDEDKRIARLATEAIGKIGAK